MFPTVVVIDLHIFSKAVIRPRIPFGTVIVKNPTIAFTTPEIVVFTVFQTSFTLFRKSSFVVYSVTKAPIKRPIRVITIPIGFALKTAFSAACAFVIAPCANAAKLIFPVRSATTVSPIVMVPLSAACTRFAFPISKESKDIATLAFCNPCTAP